MKQLIEDIINRNYDAANLSLQESFKNIMEKKLHEMKKMCAAKMSEQNTHAERMDRLKKDVIEEDGVDEGLLSVAKKKLGLKSPVSKANASEKPRPRIPGIDPTKRLRIKPKQTLEEETEQLDEEPRIGIVKLRIRGGKVQRRKKVSNVPGMILRGGKLTRMSPSEKRKRKLGAKKAARKTKAKRNQILRKRRMSLLKRQRLGG